jgi:hypothetical protein
MQAMIPCVALATFVAACSPTAPEVYNSRVYFDRWQDYFVGTSRQEYPAVIKGEPFEGQQSATEAVILKSVQTAFNRSGSRFSTDLADVEPLTPRFVILLNPGSGFAGPPCGDLDGFTPSEQAGDGALMVNAGLCRGSHPLTRAQGKVAGATGPETAPFQELISQVTLQVFRTPTGIESIEP